MAGLDPGPWTLRELVWAAQARRDDAWDHTAAVCCLIANCHRDPRRRARPFTPADFHPNPARLKRRPRKTVGIGMLRAVFVDGKGADQEMAELEQGA